MAKLNLNLLLSSVAVNDVVVAERMGTGSQLAGLRATAILSQGWPAPTGPEPTPTREVRERYRDTNRERAGRSDVSPNAGVLVTARAWHARPTIATRWFRFALDAKQQLAKQAGFTGPMLASAMRPTSGR